MIKPVGSNTPLPQKSVHVAAAAQAPLAPAAPVKARAEGDSKADPTGGLAGKAFEYLKEVGGDVNQFRKEHPVLAVLITVAGAFTGWKLDELAHRAKERADGNKFDNYGQDLYNHYKNEGADKLVAALSDEHTFLDSVKTWPEALIKGFNGATDAEKWKIFQTYAIRAEIARPTIGTYKGTANAPVALIALASNKTADKDQMQVLAAGIKTRITGTPALKDYWQPVIDALQTTHGISV
jgi:hypothetical protein